MGNKVKIRTTMEPDKVIEVDEREAEDLRRQGLVHEDKAEGSKRGAGK